MSDGTEAIMLSNGLITFLLIMSEVIGWCACKSNSISEFLLNLFKRNKCAGISDPEQQMERR